MISSKNILEKSQKQVCLSCCLVEEARPAGQPQLCTEAMGPSPFVRLLAWAGQRAGATAFPTAGFTWSAGGLSVPSIGLSYEAKWTGYRWARTPKNPPERVLVSCEQHGQSFSDLVTMRRWCGLLLRSVVCPVTVADRAVSCQAVVYYPVSQEVG